MAAGDLAAFTDDAVYYNIAGTGHGSEAIADNYATFIRPGLPWA
jgi:hypothetical protein